MIKKVILFFLPGILIFGVYKAYKFSQWKQEEKRRAPYYENIKDTSSPTVTVLRDSLSIGYRNAKKTIHLYVPPEYTNDTISRYPVIYMLDGESSFNDKEINGPEWQIDEVINSAYATRKPTAIVVGINQAKDRDAEYTPFVNDDNPNAHGDKFATWVANDLKSWVDNNFRTKTESSSTTIAGISRSGMMAYYMMMAHPDVFGNAIIQSPAMWVDYDRLIEMKISDKDLSNKKVFVSVGEHEGSVMVPHAKDIYEKFKAQGLGNDALRFELIADEGHWNLTWRKSFAKAYPWLMN